MHTQHSDDAVLRFPHSAENLATWRAAMRRSMVPMEIEEAPGTTFRGHVQQACADDVMLFQMATTPNTVRRNPAAISETDPRYYKMSLQLSGHALLEQDGRTAVLNPGDLAIYDTHRPYILRFPENSQALVMVIPQQKVNLIPEQISHVTAIAFPKSSGLGCMINPFLVEMGKNLDQLNGAYASRLVRCALDLTETMLSHQLDTRQELHIPTSHSLSREIREFILNNLGDSEMSPASIAAAHFISLRYLYTLFANEGHTVSAWIRARRLERIRRDLTDPLCSDRPISGVAAQWGLHDAAHFSRLFKTEYGESPSAYRGRHLTELLAAAG